MKHLVTNSMIALLALTTTKINAQENSNNMIAEQKIADHLIAPSKLGNEISITGKWVPTKKSGFFTKSIEAREMIKEWENIHNEAKQHDGVLSTEIDPAIGQDAVLVHHTFADERALINYFNTTASDHKEALLKVAKPDIHLIRGMEISENVREAFADKNVNGAFGEYLFGYVKDDYQAPDRKDAIQVTAKWTCKDNGSIEELIHWWQMVGTDAYEMEKELLRFEVFRVIGENALIIHETFKNTKELQFHLSKGTAHKYKDKIDLIAYPENYFFRGPVSWTIRTYSKFLNLPATYTSQGHYYTNEQGSISDGLLQNNLNNNTMETTLKAVDTKNVTVVYKWKANEGQFEALTKIYDEVSKNMEENEPGALAMRYYKDEANGEITVYDLFEDANAVGFHLGTTAGAHFNDLLQIAVPGTFHFCGPIPEEMKQQITGMGLQAEFSEFAKGFVK